MSPGKVRVVLHRPSSADNLGAAARVLKNFGLSSLSVVTSPAWEGLPRSGGSGSAREEIMARARRLARRASDVLEAAELHADLRSALATATWACGTTSRAIPGRPRLTPRQLAAEVRRRAPLGDVAMVFGEERRGLSDAELELCQAVCTIPTSAAYDSMNLAQAVAVVSYEVALAAGGAEGAERGAGDAGETGDARGSAPPGDGAEGTRGTARSPGVLGSPVLGRASGGPPRLATTEALWDRLAALLGAAGYLNPQNPEAILADWRRLLARAEPTQREVELLLAGARALERALRVSRQPGRPAGPS